jgi:hypothetical protein
VQVVALAALPEPTGKLDELIGAGLVAVGIGADGVPDESPRIEGEASRAEHQTASAQPA